MTNLVMNAIQAMPRGGESTSAFAASGLHPSQMEDSQGEYLCIRVRDEGEGIEPEHLPHVFEPFYTTKDVGEGTGLGLSVSYGIVQEHGRMDRRGPSGSGKGSTFSILLAAPSEA